MHYIEVSGGEHDAERYLALRRWLADSEHWPVVRNGYSLEALTPTPGLREAFRTDVVTPAKAWRYVIEADDDLMMYLAIRFSGKKFTLPSSNG